MDQDPCEARHKLANLNFDIVCIHFSRALFYKVCKGGLLLYEHPYPHTLSIEDMNDVHAFGKAADVDPGFCFAEGLLEEGFDLHIEYGNNGERLRAIGNFHNQFVVCGIRSAGLWKTKHFSLHDKFPYVLFKLFQIHNDICRKKILILINRFA